MELTGWLAGYVDEGVCEREREKKREREKERKRERAESN